MTLAETAQLLGNFGEFVDAIAVVGALSGPTVTWRVRILGRNASRGKHAVDCNGIRVMTGSSNDQTHALNFGNHNDDQYRVLLMG